VKQPFQLEDLDKLIARPHAANWSEVGCMKTSTALWDIEGTMTLCPPEKRGPRILIITTKTGKDPYFQATGPILPEWSIANAKTDGTADWIRGGNDPMAPRIILAHYHCFTNKAKSLEVLGLIKWDMVLLDEAHRVKNRNSQWSKNIRKIFRHVPFKRVMTGTGFVNTPDEVWALLNFLDPKKYTAYWKFREYFCLEIEVAGFRKVVGIRPNRKDEFRQLLADIGVRRTKSEVFKDLLDPIETKVFVDLSPTQRRMYNEVVNYLKTLDAEGTPITSPNVISALTRLRQIAVATPVVTGTEVDPKTGKKITHIDLTEPSSKLDAVMEILEGMSWDDDRKDSVVIFSQFAKAVDLMQARLEKAGISYIRMLPRHNELKRAAMVESFQNKEAQVFLCTIDLGGESITLTAAQTQINIDKSWSPGKNMQAAGRIHRPGQKGQAQIIDIHANNTVDNRVQKKLDKSGSWFKMLFGKDDE